MQGTSHVALLLVGLVTIAGASAVRAQDGQSTDPDASAQDAQSADQEARALFAEGRAAYEDGRFEDAVRAFRRAYLLSGRPTLLHNIGQSEIRLGRDARALDAFEGYLRHVPADDPLRPEVQERVRVLRGMGVTPEAAMPERDGDEPPPAATSTDVIPPPASTGGGGELAPWVLLGVGAAVLVGGVVMMGVAVAEASRVTNAVDGERWSDLEGAASTADVLWPVGIASGAVGLALAAIGVGWGIAGSSGGGEATLRIGPGGLAVQGRF